MTILTLPNELLLEIAKNLALVDLKIFMEVCPHLFCLLAPLLETATRAAFKLPAILWAAENSYDGLIKLMVDNGVNVHAKDSGRHTALHRAAMGRDYEKNRDAKFSVPAPKLKEQKKTISTMKLLMGYGCDVNEPKGEVRGSKGWTALHYAASSGRYLVVRFLLNSGSNINQRSTYWGKTALHMAAKWDWLAVVRVLVKSGARLNAINKTVGKTALHYAAVYGHTSILKFLLSSGADVTIRDDYGRTALHWAIDHQYMNYPRRCCTMAALLLEEGADIDAEDDEGKTPLHVAADENCFGSINFLLRRRADFRVKDIQGDTALGAVIQNGFAVKATRS